MLLDKHQQSHALRIADDLLAHLSEEASATGAGKPSVLVRMIIINRLKEGGDFSKTRALGESKEFKGGAVRMMIRFNDEWGKTLREVLDAEFGGVFTTLATGALAEHYGVELKPQIQSQKKVQPQAKPKTSAPKPKAPAKKKPATKKAAPKTKAASAKPKTAKPAAAARPKPRKTKKKTSAPQK